MGIDKRTLPAIGTLIEGRCPDPSAKGKQIKPVFEIVAHRYDEEDDVHLLELGESKTIVTAGPVKMTTSTRLPPQLSAVIPPRSEVSRGELMGYGIPYTAYQAQEEGQPPTFFAATSGEVALEGKGSTIDEAQMDLSRKIVALFSPSDEDADN